MFKLYIGSKIIPFLKLKFLSNLICDTSSQLYKNELVADFSQSESESLVTIESLISFVAGIRMILIPATNARKSNPDQQSMVTRLIRLSMVTRLSLSDCEKSATSSRPNSKFINIAHNAHPERQSNRDNQVQVTWSKAQNKDQ